MERFDREVKQALQDEADQLLFPQLHFDDRLKAGVRQQLGIENTKPDSNQTAPSRNQTANHKKKWLFATSAAVAASLALMLSTSMWSPEQPPMITFQGTEAESPLANNDEGTLGTFSAPADAPVTPFTAQMESWLLTTEEEAIAAFGDELLFPAYLPDGFTRMGMNATGISRENTTREASEITVLYLSLDRSFQLRAWKEPLLEVEEYDKKVTVGEAEGYLIANRSWPTPEEGGIGERMLLWSVDEIHYSIAGRLTEEEILAIARSMR